MTDSKVETMVTVELGDGGRGHGKRNFGGLTTTRPAAPDVHTGAGTGAEPGLVEPGLVEPGLVELGFQEYFVGFHHSVEVKGIRFAGADSGAAGTRRPGGHSWRRCARDLPLQPDRLDRPPTRGPRYRRRRGGAAHRRGRRLPHYRRQSAERPADRMLTELGFEASAVGVARLWSHLAATLVVDQQDADLAAEIEAEGMRCVVAPSVMSGPMEAANLARVVLGTSARC